MWVYIIDSQRRQILWCKQYRNAGTDVVDKLCIGVTEGSFFGEVYNETIKFDTPAYEGWNFVGAIFDYDAAEDYTRIRIVDYHKSAVTASYKYFSYRYFDDPEYDFYLGGNHGSDGQTVLEGFAGWILQLRIYSEVALTLDNFDSMVEWECTGNPNYHFCDMCPLYITTDLCLEDFSNPGGGT